jgi:hypothetical protein
MRHTLQARGSIIVATATTFTAIGAFAFLAACESPSVGGDPGTTVEPIPTASDADPCATPNAACACSVPGSTLACGEVVQRAGTYATCSMGTRTCSNSGQWGSCIGEYVTQQSLPGASDLRITALNPTAKCVSNPCDPACNTFINDPSGLDAGVDSGLTIRDSGVFLLGVPVNVTVCSSLQVTPSTAPAKDLAVTSFAPSPNSVQYTASLQPAACYPGTPTFLWSIDKYDVAQISASGLLTLAVPIAGPITISAYAGTLSTTVVCNVTVNVVDTSAAPSGSTNAQFPTTTGATQTLSVLYPYPATVFPLGLPSPLIQWSITGTTASAVKMTLRFPATGTPIFSWSEIVPELQTVPTPTLTGQPRATIPQTVWNAFQQTVVRNSGATGGDAVFAIQRYVSGTLQAEVPTTIHFANGQLKGTVYYNSYGTNLVKNFASTLGGASFGAATLAVPVNGTTPTVVVGYTDATNSGAGCRVCHSASADGSRIISNSYLSNGSTGSGATEQTTYMYNSTLATPALIQGSESLVGAAGGNVFTYAALAPDGSYMLSSAAPASAANASKVYSPTGTLITSNIPTSLQAATPAFSPDAKHVAFNFYAGSSSPLLTGTGSTGNGSSLSMMDFAAPGTFSNFRTLYTPTSPVYTAWPTFLPAGQNGIVFQNEVTGNTRDWAGTRSTCDSTGTCNNIGATAEMWWVSTDSTPTATRLANLNGGSYMPRNNATTHGTAAQNATYYEEVYNYEPTALPVTIGGYSWIAFTSRRLYGNVATINPYWSDPRYQDLSVQPTTKKIWIAAIGPNPVEGTDPSFPAFYLPGQELLAGNSRGYFALAACEAPGTTAASLCSSNLDCCGATTAPTTAACQLDPPPLANPPTSHCVATVASACVADGVNCTSDAQCCNFATGSRCGSGTCQPIAGLLLYSTATFTTTYTSTCGTGTRPVWRFLYWKTVTPNGTSIAFAAQTSATGATWGASVGVGTSAPPPNVTSTWTSGPLTVDQALVANGQVSLTQLKITATLNPSSDQTQTPTLTNWQLQYDCVANE